MKKNVRILSLVLAILIFSNTLIVQASTTPPVTSKKTYSTVVNHKSNPNINDDKNREKVSIPFWDVLDFVMCAQSIREFINAPSLLGFAFVIIDGAALAPFIPSSGYIRRGASAIIAPSAIKRLSKTEDGMNAILNSTRGVKRFGDVTDTVRTLAKHYDLSETQYVDHILYYHGSSSTIKDKNKFKSIVDIKSVIDNALTSPNSIIKQNTDYILSSRKGFTIEYKVGSAIGVDTNGMACYSIRVIINEIGEVITAFPIR